MDRDSPLVPAGGHQRSLTLDAAAGIIERLNTDDALYRVIAATPPGLDNECACNHLTSGNVELRWLKIVADGVVVIGLSQTDVQGLDTVAIVHDHEELTAASFGDMTPLLGRAHPGRGYRRQLTRGRDP